MKSAEHRFLKGKNLDGSVKSIVNYSHTEQDVSLDSKVKFAMLTT